MIIEHNGARIKILGDPHLGRRFITGVPLHRRGDREEMVWKQLKDDLNDVAGVDYHICVGDLFEKADVSYTTLIRAVDIYRIAALENHDTHYIVMAGNHDFYKDTSLRSGFDAFAAIVTPLVDVIMEPLPLGDIALLPWHLSKTADELVAEVAGFGCTIGFGHFDLDPRSDPRTLIPTKALAEAGIKTFYNGHVHLPSRFMRDGVEVIGVGSMQPYAHGEDLYSDFYQTLSLEGVRLSLLNYGNDYFHNRVLRIDLEEGEALDFEVDCLQLATRTITKEMKEAELASVEVANFNLSALVHEALAENGVGESVGQLLVSKLNEYKDA